MQQPVCQQHPQDKGLSITPPDVQVGFRPPPRLPILTVITSPSALRDQVLPLMSCRSQNFYRNFSNSCCKSFQEQDILIDFIFPGKILLVRVFVLVVRKAIIRGSTGVGSVRCLLPWVRCCVRARCSSIPCRVFRLLSCMKCPELWGRVTRTRRILSAAYSIAICSQRFGWGRRVFSSNIATSPSFCTV